MPTKPRPALFATLTGIAFATAASYGLATPQAAVDVVTSARAPLTLHLEDASGNAVRLVHLPGVGWQYDRGDRAADSPLQKTALQTTATPSAGTSGDDVPLTVFIDGPSGFTYVWNRDDGWKCVGRLVDDAQ